MNLFHDIERAIDEKLRKLFRQEGVPAGRETVEIMDVILGDVSSRVQLLPRGRRLFPYNSIVFRLLAEDDARKATLYSVFVQGNALEQAILRHLRSDGVEVGELSVQVEIVDEVEAYNSGPFAAYQLQKAENVSRPATRFTLSEGLVIALDKARIHVGRGSEVLDEKRRLVRRNDLVVEHDTVSRGHAHIEYIDGAYRLFDDGSSYGTSVVHEGRLVDVPKAGARGQRLASGDELYFGQARVTVEFMRG